MEHYVTVGSQIDWNSLLQIQCLSIIINFCLLCLLDVFEKVWDVGDLLPIIPNLTYKINIMTQLNDTFNNSCDRNLGDGWKRYNVSKYIKKKVVYLWDILTN